jgi:predicted GTPase
MIKTKYEASIGADVIIVTGAAGAGKSSLIKSITGHDVYESSSLKSGKLFHNLKCDQSLFDCFKELRRLRLFLL